MTQFFKNRVFLSIGLGAMLALSGCSEANETENTTATQTAWSTAHVDAKGANALLTANPETIVLDIRTPGEIEGGYIDGAVFADFSQADFENQLTKLDRDKAYIVHCKGGGRSTKALSSLEKLGFKNVTHMDGGLDDWKRAKLPLVTP